MLFHFIHAIHAFLVHSLFGRIKKVLSGLFLLGVTTIISCAPEDVVLQKELNIQQIFHLLNKKIQKISRDFSLNQTNNFEKLYLKK